MKKPEQPFPHGPYSIKKIGDVDRVVDRNGNDVTLEPNGMQRLVDCANALSKVWSPQNHVDATEDYVKRLEQLRKDAWARVVLDWNTDISAAPRGHYVSKMVAGKDVAHFFVPDRVILATKCGKVTLSHYEPKQGRWDMLAKGEQPVAWQPWPTHPNSLPSPQKAAETPEGGRPEPSGPPGDNSRSDAGLDIVMTHTDIRTGALR